MEMWHNGEQASGATIAVGATVQRVRVSSHPPHLPPLVSALSLSLSPSLTHLPPSHFTGKKNIMFEQEF